MDTEALDRLRLAGIEQVIEGGARLGAAIFLGVVLYLLLRAKRRSRSDLLLGAVFTTWLAAILVNAARYVLGFPPQYLHWSIYVVITLLEMATVVSMLRESNRIRRLNRKPLESPATPDTL